MNYVILLVGFAISISCYSQNAKIDLKKTKRISINSETQVSLISEIGGTTIVNNSSKIKYQQLDVITKHDSVFDVTLSVKKLVVTLTSKNDEMVFDSDKNDNPLIMAETYNKEAQYLNHTKITSNGYLIKGDSLSANSVLLIDPMTSNTVYGSIPVLHTTINCRNLKQGDQWKDSVSAKIAGIKTDIVGIYTVLETMNSEMIIEFTGNQKFSGIIKQGNNEINSTGDCKIKADITVNLKTGLIVRLFTTYEGVISMDMNSLIVPVTIKTVNKMEAK